MLFLHQYPVGLRVLYLNIHVLFSYQVMVFAKSYCPYCKRSRALLAQWEDSIDMYILNLDLMDQEDGALVQMELLQKTGQRTVPNSKYNNASDYA
jgi:glutaredoxin 3